MSNTACASTALRALAVLLFAALAAPAAAVGVTANNLECSGCVGTNDLGKDAVTSEKIRKGTISNSDLGPNARAAGTKFKQSVGASDINTDTVVNTIVLNAPSSGYVIVTASGYFFFGGGANEVYCSITTDSVLGTDTFAANGGGSGDTVRQVFSSTKAFSVAKGRTRFRLICTADNVAYNVAAPRTNMVGLFVPNRY